jgi:hypothetical protein
MQKKHKKHKKELLVKEYHSNHYTCPKCFHHARYIDCSACEPIEKTLQGNYNAFCHYLDKEKNSRCDWKGKVKDLLPENLEAPPTEEELKASEYYRKHARCPNCRGFVVRLFLIPYGRPKPENKNCKCPTCDWCGQEDELVEF